VEFDRSAPPLTFKSSSTADFRWSFWGSFTRFSNTEQEALPEELGDFTSSLVSCFFSDSSYQRLFYPLIPNISSLMLRTPSHHGLFCVSN
jgi:hypothetical protein